MTSHANETPVEPVRTRLCMSRQTHRGSQDNSILDSSLGDFQVSHQTKACLGMNQSFNNTLWHERHARDPDGNYGCVPVICGHADNIISEVVSRSSPLASRWTWSHHIGGCIVTMQATTISSHIQFRFVWMMIFNMWLPRCLIMEGKVKFFLMCSCTYSSLLCNEPKSFGHDLKWMPTTVFAGKALPVPMLFLFQCYTFLIELIQVEDLYFNLDMLSLGKFIPIITYMSQALRYICNFSFLMQIVGA